MKPTVVSLAAAWRSGSAVRRGHGGRSLQNTAARNLVEGHVTLSLSGMRALKTLLLGLAIRTMGDW